MAKKRKTSSAPSIKKSSGGEKMSPVIQFAVVFIIVAAIALAYYVGTLK